jgi:hypothetical protein
MRPQDRLFACICLLSAAVAARDCKAQSIAVPEGERITLRTEGKGVQIYRCDTQAQTANQTAQWTFVAPEADLTVDGTRVGTHDAGPAWHYKDGSSVIGEVVTKADSPNPASIPMLLLKVKQTSGHGLLTPVNYIVRSETRGGIAPPSGCDAAHAGATVRVPYSAVYTFYVAR